MNEKKHDSKQTQSAVISEYIPGSTLAVAYVLFYVLLLLVFLEWILCKGKGKFVPVVK